MATKYDKSTELIFVLYHTPNKHRQQLSFFRNKKYIYTNVHGSHGKGDANSQLSSVYHYAWFILIFSES
jgi:uncharacterized protein YggU (UPF0235/DUF167 family)